jgi:hypothetical protein
MNNCILLFLQAHYQISRREHVTYETNAQN